MQFTAQMFKEASHANARVARKNLIDEIRRSDPVREGLIVAGTRALQYLVTTCNLKSVKAQKQLRTAIVLAEPEGK